MPAHAIKVYLRAIHKFFVDTVSHELGRGLARGLGVSEGSGDVVLVAAASYFAKYCSEQQKTYSRSEQG